MLRRKLFIAGLLPLLALPLMGESCTKEKLIFLAVGIDTTAGFVASGSTNVLDDTNQIDVKEDLDLTGVLEDNDIDAEEVNSIKVSRVYYRVTVPEAGRTITDGDVTIQRDGVSSPLALVSNFTGDASAATDWIEITDRLSSAAVTMLNTFMAECLTEAKGGAPAQNTTFTYSVSGTSNPVNVGTNFEWELKVSFLVDASQTVEVPEL